MATSLPWSVKGVDPRTRDAAKTAARRAGMTLGEWLDSKIREEAGEPATVPPEAEEQDIVALSDRLARLSQGGMQTAASPQGARIDPTRERIDAFITQAAMAERLTRDSNARTANALDSIAQWMERTESRLAQGERTTVERQERTTSVIADSIKAMGERLSEIERRTAEANHRPVAQPARPALSREGLAAAVSDIRSRQRTLDEGPRTPALERSGHTPTLANLRDDLRQLSDRIAPAQPALRAEEQRAAYKPLERAISEIGARLDRLDGRDRLDPVLKPLARIEAEIGRLSETRPQESYNRLELEIAHLAAKVDALATRGGDRQVIAPILNELAELREIVSAPGGRQFDDLSLQLSALTSDVGRLRDDTRDLRSLSLAIEDVRESLHTDRLRERNGESGPLLALSRQVESLAHKIDSLPVMKTSVIDGQVEQLVARLGELDAIGRPVSNELAERVEALVIKLEHLAERPPSQLEDRIEALADRVEQLTASSALAQMVDEGGAAPLARVDMRPVEDMLRGLAAKIDEAGRPGAGSDSFDALERQIEGLTQRLDQQAATRSAEHGIERTLQDLVVHLQGMREDTAAAAERAARAAMADLPAPRGASLSELSDLMSGLRESHVSTGRETQDAIGAVHRTLETIIGRLGDLEAELGGERERPNALSAPAPRVRAPALADEEIKVAAPAMPMAERFAAEQRPPRIGGLDMPLEPGSGRPRPDAPAPQGNDPQAVRQSLIAAARRSAKAASEAAAANPAGASETAKPGRPASGGRLKAILEKRRRPLLLGLAALVLAIGAAQVFSGGQQGDAKKQLANESSRTGTTTAAPVETPAAKPAPQNAPAEPATPPAKDQSSALPPLQIGTTPVQAAAPAPAQAASAEPPPIASVPSMVASMPLQSPSEAVESVTGIGELPGTAGSAGMRKAALAGDARAVYQIAAQAADGPGNRDPKLALRLFERAAVAGLTPAQFRLGNMFEKGIGTNRDPALAKVWYGRAAERGNAKAMHNLAVLYAEGAGGKPDYATATEWFRRAAEHGVRDSQYNLAILLGRGLGAPADLGQSYRWFAIAAAQGDDDAARKRDEVASRLTASDLAAAKATAESWKPKALEANANEVTPPAKGWDEAPVAAKKPAKPGRG
jgi:localization factor PodJL